MIVHRDGQISVPADVHGGIGTVLNAGAFDGSGALFVQRPDD